jgi:hypothetical protein
VNCKTQNEIDEMWDKLQAGGGSPSQCGWLTDKDKAKREKVLAAVMKMQKLKYSFAWISLLRVPFYLADKDHSCYAFDYKRYCSNQLWKTC